MPLVWEFSIYGISSIFIKGKIFLLQNISDGAVGIGPAVKSGHFIKHCVSIYKSSLLSPSTCLVMLLTQVGKTQSSNLK